jgi:hypothetical protein
MHDIKWMGISEIIFPLTNNSQLFSQGHACQQILTQIIQHHPWWWDFVHMCNGV